MYAVVVTFQIAPDQLASFLPLMRANAEISLQSEDGCHHFDVCTDTARPEEVFLYELYTDKAAFDAHLASPHFKVFDKKVAAMITAKEVRTYRDVNA